jgi:hypothetical protein
MIELDTHECIVSFDDDEMGVVGGKVSLESPEILFHGL